MIRNRGDSNIIAGGNVIFSVADRKDRTNYFEDFFNTVDNMFRQRVSEKIRKGAGFVPYSSKLLFTSLMRLGLPFEVASNILFCIIPVLENILEDDDKGYVSVTDIRTAVVECIASQADRYRPEEISMWTAAYIRRYGDPDLPNLKVIDNGNEIELTFDYVKRNILPDLFRRVLGLQEFDNPLEKYRPVFSSLRVDSMAEIIINLSNSLNMYAIRRETLMNLLQDMVLEPPHPWIVNEKTIGDITRYNVERASYHLCQMVKSYSSRNSIHFQHSSKELFMHLSAAILSKYGAFLGVGSSYGLLELRRALEKRFENLVLWEYCRLREIEGHLKNLGKSVDQLRLFCSRVFGDLNFSGGGCNFEVVCNDAIAFSRLVSDLVGDCEYSKKLSACADSLELCIFGGDAE